LKMTISKKGKHYSSETEFKKDTFKADKHYNWKGGKYISTQGYVFLYSPGHPLAINSNSYVAEHRLIAENLIGRYLAKEEVVHHINHIKTDNRPENLYLFPNNSKHLSFHKNEYLLTSNII